MADSSKVRIIAYFMHEAEQQAAFEMLDPSALGNEGKSRIEQTNSFIMGDATQDEIRELQEQGLLIQQVETRPRMDGAEPNANEVFSVEEGQTAQRYLLQLAGPMLPDRARLLSDYGVTLVESLPNDYYRVEVTPDTWENVGMLPFVVALRSERAASQPTLESLQIPDDQVARGSFENIDGTNQVQTAFDLWLKDGVDRISVQQQLAQLGVVLLGGDGRKIRLLVVPGSPQHRQISSMPDVEIMEEYLQPDWHNEHARRIMRLTTAGPAPVDLPWDGSGQIVAVADTGLDDQHPDFAGRIVALVALGRPGVTDDPHGHGTHVSGSVLGNGAASGGPLKGALRQQDFTFSQCWGRRHRQTSFLFPDFLSL